MLLHTLFVLFAHSALHKSHNACVHVILKVSSKEKKENFLWTFARYSRPPRVFSHRPFLLFSESTENNDLNVLKLLTCVLFSFDPCKLLNVSDVALIRDLIVQVWTLLPRKARAVSVCGLCLLFDPGVDSTCRSWATFSHHVRLLSLSPIGRLTSPPRHFNSPQTLPHLLV